MFRNAWLAALLAAVLMMTAVFAATVSNATRARAQASDPGTLVEALKEALNLHQGEAATALFAPDGVFSVIDGGSFAAVGQTAVGSIFTGVAEDSNFHVEVASSQVSGNTMTGVFEVTDSDAVAAGVDRYRQPFTIGTADGKFETFDLRYDTSDSQTATYLAYVDAQGDDGGGDQGPSIEVTLAGARPGSAFVGDAGGDIAAIFAGVTPGPAGVLQPANLYAGSCGALGDVASRLAVVSDGGSGTLLSPPNYQQLISGQYAIAVLASDSDSTVVSCGNVVASGSGIHLPNTGSGSAPSASPFTLLAIGLALLGAAAILGTGSLRLARRR